LSANGSNKRSGQNPHCRRQVASAGFTGLLFLTGRLNLLDVRKIALQGKQCLLGKRPYIWIFGGVLFLLKIDGIFFLIVHLGFGGSGLIKLIQWRNETTTKSLRLQVEEDVFAADSGHNGK
jgi:hypothetical protein